MALTQKMLKALGVEDEDKREQILDEHQSVLREIREERDRLRDEAAKVPDLQRQLEEAKNANEGNGEWQKKFEKAQRDLEDYKTQVEAKEAERAKAKAYREQVLGAAGVDPRRVDSIMRLADLSGVKVKDGKVEGADRLIEGVRSEWSDFIVRSRTKGANVANPPSGGDDRPQASEIAKQVIRERQQRLYGNKVTDEGGNE